MSKDWTNTESTIHFKTAQGVETIVQVNGAPAVASTSKGRLDVFVRGMDNHLYHNVLVDGVWPENWEDITPKDKLITTSPAAVAWGPNRVDVFAVWESLEHEHAQLVKRKYVHHNYRELKQGDKGWGWYWSGWTYENFEGATTIHAPAVVSFEPDSFDRFEVFVRNEDNGHLKRKTWLSGVETAKLGKEEGWGRVVWDDLDDTGGGLISAPSAVRSAEGQHIDFFSVNANGYLQHRREDYGGKPTAWTQFDTSIKPKANDAPAAASAKTADGRVDVFVRDNADGRLKKRWFNRMKNLQEDKWVDTEGSIYSAPVAVAWYEGAAPKRLDVFAEGANKTLLHSCWIAG